MNEKLPELPPQLLDLRRAATSAIVCAYELVGAHVKVEVRLVEPPTPSRRPATEYVIDTGRKIIV